MLPYRHNSVTTAAFALFFVLVLGYSYYEARGILFGPTISVASQAAAVHDPFVKITGKADRINELAMNDRTVNVTQDGTFDEPYLLTPGINRIELRAKDAYGRVSEKTVEIAYEPLAVLPVEAANTGTTTPTASLPPLHRGELNASTSPLRGTPQEGN